MKTMGIMRYHREGAIVLVIVDAGYINKDRDTIELKGYNDNVIFILMSALVSYGIACCHARFKVPFSWEQK